MTALIDSYILTTSIGPKKCSFTMTISYMNCPYRLKGYIQVDLKTSYYWLPTSRGFFLANLLAFTKLFAYKFQEL